MRIRLFFFVILASLANLAAAEGNGNLHWRCWYDQQVHITCVIDTVSEADSATQLFLPNNLPALVRTMRTAPQALRGSIIHIPLLGYADDMDFTAALAQATVCGSRRDCTVHFTASLPPAEEVVALLNKHLPGRAPATALAMLGNDLDDIE